jgi:hypothetical protein
VYGCSPGLLGDLTRTVGLSNPGDQLLIRAF